MSAFASSALDILVKPFDAKRFQSALELARSRIAGARMELELEKRSSDQEQPRPARRFLQRLAVEANEEIVLVRVDDIRWMQSPGNHIRLHLSKTSYLIRQSMKNLQTMLDPNRLLRVHRNAIVNLDHVRGVSFAAEWQYVREAERWTVPTSTKSQSSITAETAEGHLVV